jgi:hypothetical protein
MKFLAKLFFWVGIGGLAVVSIFLVILSIKLVLVLDALFLVCVIIGLTILRFQSKKEKVS